MIKEIGVCGASWKSAIHTRKVIRMFFDKKSELLDKAISVAEDWKETCEKYQALLNKTLNDLKEAQEKVIRLTEQNNKLVLEVAMFRKKEGD